jgi:hypothetical protein
MRGSSANRARRVPRGAFAALIAAGLATAMLLHGGVPSRAADERPITIELNKLEPQDKSCRAYFLVDNPGDTALNALKLDLVLFRTDGVIDRRLSLNLSPVLAHKKSVRIFDFSDLPCQNVGSALLNDITECTAAAGPVADCAERLSVTSRAAAPFSK